MDAFMIALILGFCISIIALILLLFETGGIVFEFEKKRVGRQGEWLASRVIKEILNEKDILLTNVKVSFDGKDAELDNVIINNRGVFVIEVKNYKGRLIGTENDFKWIKIKYTKAGNCYHTLVRNPIKQVGRQVYILSGCLKEHGINLWIEGYVFFVEGNSPIESERVLSTQEDINTVIHLGVNNKLKNISKEKIVEILS